MFPKRIFHIHDILKDKFKNNFFEQIILTREHINIIFQYDFIEGFNIILHSVLSHPSTSSSTHLPLCAFSHNANVIYAYHKDDIKKWIILSNNKLDKIINIIYKKIIGELKVWQDENKSRICKKDFNEIYINNVKKILDLPKTLLIRVKKGLFNHLKTDFIPT